MEWLLIGGALMVWLVYREARARKRAGADARTRRAISLQEEHDGEAAVPGGAGLLTLPWGRDREASGAGRGGAARWLAPGDSVTIAGITIESGMVYIGGVLPGRTRGHSGNCVIDPDCVVASAGGDPEGRSMPYWPSYQSIQPVARRTYLQWLAGGRNDPAIGIGYVFLFFYGIEHRLLVEGAKAEAPMLIAELRRLLSLHGQSSSFRGYASRLLDAARLCCGLDIPCPALSPELRDGYEMPLPVRLHLGRKLAARQRLDSADALLWLLALPDRPLRAPARRCFDELAELWHLRFKVRYPDGLRIDPPRTRLKLDYRAASGGFTRRIDAADASGPLPDIAAISAPLDGLRDMLNGCAEELAAYSRLLGRNPKAKGTMDAAFLLPRDLLTSSSAEMAAAGMAAAVAEIERLFGGERVACVTVARLAGALSLKIAPAGRLATGVCDQIGAFLDKLDIGFEPDRRYGSPNLEAEGHVSLFKAQGGGGIDGEAPGYVVARAMVDVSALAAAVDGRVEADEYETIMTDIMAFPGIGGLERTRLIAYAAVLLENVPRHRSALRRIKHLDDGAKEAIVKSAIAAILADGHAGPDEVKFLERLYKSLGFPVEAAYSALHRGAVVIDDLVTVAPETRQPGVAIPPMDSDRRRRQGLAIDQARLERIRSETSAVSALLAEIFTEDEPPAPAPPAGPVGTDGHQGFAGLDAAHRQLLAGLLAADGMDRAAFDEAARRLRLLPDGAIETINDWGFDRFDEPVIGDDDPIMVMDHLKAELKGAQAAQ